MFSKVFSILIVALLLSQYHGGINTAPAPGVKCQPNYNPPPATTSTPTAKPTSAIPPRNTTKSHEALNVSPATFLGDILCTGPGYFAAEKCNEYYECAPLFKWFKAVLGTCKEGYFFSEVNRPCSMPPNVVCTTVE